MTEMVLCVPSNKIWYPDGFTLLFGDDVAANHHIYELLDNYATLEPRNEVEDNIDFKQFIVYVIVSKGDCWYKYQRAGGDDRLIDRYSIGIGGHVNLQDMRDADYDTVHAIEGAVRRELGEEIVIPDWDKIKNLIWLGVINDNSDRVGQVHLGIVIELVVDEGNVYVAEDNLVHGGFENINTIQENIDKYESWSQILIDLLGE